MLPALRRSSALALAPPSLVAALACAVGCSALPSDPVGRLERGFPTEGRAALGRPGGGFVEAGPGFQPARPAGPLSVTLPRRSDGAIALEGPAGLSVAVREVASPADGRLAENAVVYAREGITSYWTTSAGRVEEWLHVDAGVATAAAPLLAWEIAGARLEQRGAGVDVLGAQPLAKLRVTAPAAYAAGGRPIEARLRVAGDRIELYVDAAGEELLVDPLWQAVAPLNTARYYHSASLLQTGEVLVAGGTQGIISNELASTEIYDPVADTWTPAGPLSTARARHTSTTLADGTVLVAGGEYADGQYVVSNVDIYDPASGWNTGPYLSNARSNHTASTLQDGRVLVAGGYGGSGTPVSLQDAEIYDPASPGWTYTLSMNAAHASHTAAVLADGRVLVAGGDDYGSASNFAELYDPAADTWTQTGTLMNVPRINHASAQLQDGTVLVLGGDDGFNPMPDAEIYDPTTDSWLPVGQLTFPRTHATATVLADGRVLVAGGESTSFSYDSSEIYDPASQTFTLGPDLVQARADHSATLLQTGDVLVAGGDDGGQLSSSEIFVVGAPNGTPCGVGGECLTGFCVDGVCCEAQCSAGCMACTAALTGLASDGLCGPVDVGTDPHNACPMQSSSSCGKRGNCDGSGKCQLYPATTLCQAAFCGGKGDEAYPDSYCDGNGSCDYQSGTYCPDGCQNAQCIIYCNNDPDCPTDQYCNGSQNMCVQDKPVGSPATRPEQCDSGFLADGVCCDAACDVAPCMVCSVAAGATADGTCTNTTANCDDGDACTQTDTCQGGACVGANPVTCTAPDECHVAGTCNPANGNCSVVEKPDDTMCGMSDICTVGTCQAGVCTGDAKPDGTACGMDDVCNVGQCMTGVCSPTPRPNGTSCGGDNPCTNDVCVIGACTEFNRLDGTLCDGGVCVAGACVLDPSTGAGTAGAGPTTSSGAAGGSGPKSGTGGAGGAADGSGVDKGTELVGGGCLAVPAAPARDGGWLFGALLAWLAARRRRR